MTSDPLSRYLTQHGARLERQSRLRVMTTAEVNDLALQVYQTLGRPILRLTALPTVFCLAAFAFILQVVFPALTQTSQPGNINVMLGEAAIALGLGIFVGVPLFLLGVAYITGAVTSLVSDFMIGNVPDPEASRREAAKFLPKLLKLKFRELLVSMWAFLASFLLLMLSAYLDRSNPYGWEAGLVSMVGVVGILAGFIVLAVVHSSHALAPIIVQIEGLKAGEAAKRSRYLLKSVRGDSSSTALTNAYALIILIWLILAASIGTLLGFIEAEGMMKFLGGGSWFSTLFSAVLEMLPWYLMLWVTIPIWSATATIVYFERRVRKEGYDIEALAKDVISAGRQGRFQL